MKLNVNDILSHTAHRPYDIPAGEWKYYQEWNDAVFLHWKVPYETIRPHVPSKLILDDHNGDFYVSIVAFTMEKIKLRYLPAIGFISNFHEINIRTYVDNNGLKGVYFLNIEASKTISAYIAKAVSGLPYEKSRMTRSPKRYNSKNIIKGFSLVVEFEILDEIKRKAELEKWLTERYCLYLEGNRALYRYDVHHEEWTLRNIQLKKLQLQYKIGDFTISQDQPNLVQYSKGVKVLGWDKVRL